ncbi:MAG: hypothetical protein IJ080_00745, partial [Oscillospiraceae bacterium]|nr:hypothetical protein [Oscillospiraceae bacterium]
PDDHIARMRADDNYDEIVSTLFGDGVSGGTIEDIADMCISGEHDIQYTLNDEHHIITVHLGPADETEGEE